jgi:hypothetical protein
MWTYQGSQIQPFCLATLPFHPAEHLAFVMEKAMSFHSTQFDRIKYCFPGQDSDFEIFQQILENPDQGSVVLFPAETLCQHQGLAAVSEIPTLHIEVQQRPGSYMVSVML